MDLEKTLETFFRDHAPLTGGETVLIAFSGGADSTALLFAMREFAGPRAINVVASHIDHQLDPDSRARADAAQSTAAALGIQLALNRQDVSAQKERGESLEMAARRIRYRELERSAAELGARYIATAHHRDDQAETVLLRLAAGHGLSGLGAVPNRRGSIVRPLLEESRSELRRFVRQRGLAWVEDPTNRNIETPRNRLRHRMIPWLEARNPGIRARLSGLAGTARRANIRLARELARRLCPSEEGATVTVSRVSLEELPTTLVPYAITHLLRSAGSDRRPSGRALGYVETLLASQAPIGVDLGGGWRIEDAKASSLRILRIPEATPPFVYNLTAPGEVRLDELSSSLTLRAGRVEPWIFRGARSRAGLSLPSGVREHLTVRNRRPGDRVQALGSSSRHKLKDLLIDHGIPRYERDRLPLLCHSDRILWVPGVTIDHGARIRDGADVWVAEIKSDE